MYRTAQGEEIFVVDGHLHFWDASPANQKNKYGEGFIGCFYDYHKNLSPSDYVWPRDKFEKYDEPTMMRDVFENGYVDVGIFQPTYLTDFYTNGFNRTEQDAVLKEKYPDRFILNGSFDPRDGEKGLKYLEELHRKYQIQGVKLYTAEWRGESKGWKLDSPEAKRYLQKCQDLGIKNIHVHKGPTIWPLNKDAFDVADAEVLAELLFWVGEDKLLFASDYAIWSPKWIIDKFMAFELPEDLKKETGVDLTPVAKRKILGENAARLYGLDIEAHQRTLAGGLVGAKQ